MAEIFRALSVPTLSSSVADPGLLSHIPDHDLYPFRISDPESKNSNKICSVADPDAGSGAFLTPGSGIGFFRIPDPGSRIPDPKPIHLRA
jgi:hypothetical protein